MMKTRLSDFFKKTTFIIGFCICGLTMFGQAGSTTLTSTYFHNGFSGADINDADQTIFLFNEGMTTAQANDTLGMNINGVQSYNTLFIDSLSHPIDISGNPYLTVMMQTRNLSLAETDAGPSLSLIWYLVDVNGNSAQKDAWERDIYIPLGSKDMSKFVLDMSKSPQSCDLTKIVKIALHNQSHNSDYSKNRLTGNIIIGDIEIGKKPADNSEVTLTSYFNDFKGTELSDLNQTTITGANNVAVQQDDVLQNTLTSVAANANISTTTLTNPLDLSLAANPKFKLKVQQNLTGGSMVKIYLVDMADKKTVAKDIDLSTLSKIDFAIEAGDANLMNIKKIVIDNGSAVLSGTITIDSMFVGDYSAKIVREPRTLEIPGQLHKNANIDGIAEAGIWANVPKTNLDRFVFWDNAYSSAPTAENISGYFQTYYTSDSLYFFVDVTDDLNSPVPDGSTTPWLYDGIEVYVNPKLANDQANGAYGDDAVQIGIKRKTVSVKAKDQAGLVKFSYAINEKASNGYSVELAISISDLKLPISDNYSFGGEVSVTDADSLINSNNRTRKVIWNMDLHNDVAYNNTNSFGTFKLAPIPVVNVAETKVKVETKIITVALSPAVDGLTAANFVISKDAANLTLKSATTTDNGATYSIESRNAFIGGSEYLLTTTMAGFDFNTLNFVYDGVGIKESSGIAVRVFPNPVTDVLNVEGEDLNIIEIESSTGVTVKSVVATAAIENIPVNDLSNGLYLIKITTKQGQSLTQKFIKK